VGATDPRMAHLRDIEDVPEFDRLEIHHFFEVYKALESGKEVHTAAWVDQAAAWAEIESCRERLALAATMAASATPAGLTTAVTDDQVILDPLPPATRRAIDRSASGREDE